MTTEDTRNGFLTASNDRLAQMEEQARRMQERNTDDRIALAQARDENRRVLAELREVEADLERLAIAAKRTEGALTDAGCTVSGDPMDHERAVKELQAKLAASESLQRSAVAQAADLGRRLNEQAKLHDELSRITGIEYAADYAWGPGPIDDIIEHVRELERKHRDNWPISEERDALAARVAELARLREGDACEARASARFAREQHDLTLDVVQRLRTELDDARSADATSLVLYQQAHRLLREVKSWRDSDGNDGFPHELRERIDGALAGRLVDGRETANNGKCIVCIRAEGEQHAEHCAVGDAALAAPTFTRDQASEAVAHAVAHEHATIVDADGKPRIDLWVPAKQRDALPLCTSCGEQTWACCQNALCDEPDYIRPEGVHAPTERPEPPLPDGAELAAMRVVLREARRAIVSMRVSGSYGRPDRRNVLGCIDALLARSEQPTRAEPPTFSEDDVCDYGAIMDVDDATADRFLALLKKHSRVTIMGPGRILGTVDAGPETITLDEARAELKAAGIDPDAIGKRGAALVAELLAKRRAADGPTEQPAPEDVWACERCGAVVCIDQRTGERHCDCPDTPAEPPQPTAATGDVARALELLHKYDRHTLDSHPSVCVATSDWRKVIAILESQSAPPACPLPGTRGAEKCQKNGGG